MELKSQSRDTPKCLATPLLFMQPLIEETSDEFFDSAKVEYLELG